MIWLWVGFIAFVLLLLALDLGVFNRQAHVISVKEALAWSAMWITLGLAFAIFVYHGYEGHWLGLGVGIKMLIAPWLKALVGKHFNLYLLGLVFVVLAAGIAASLLLGRRKDSAER